MNVWIHNSNKIIMYVLLYSNSIWFMCTCSSVLLVISTCCCVWMFEYRHVLLYSNMYHVRLCTVFGSVTSRIWRWRFKPTGVTHDSEEDRQWRLIQAEQVRVKEQHKLWVQEVQLAIMVFPCPRGCGKSFSARDVMNKHNRQCLVDGELQELR